MPPLTAQDVARATSVQLLINAGETQRALRAFSRDLERETRREMAALSRKARDDIRGDWPVGPAKGGHSKLAVASGTHGLIPYVALRRDYKPYVGWLVFGGRRARDRVTRPRLGDGRWFYPGIARARPIVVARSQVILATSIRRAGLN
jgi:hypothetical protein